MKRIIPIVLVLAILFCFSACSKNPVKSEYPGFTNTLYCGKYAFSSEDLQLTACYNSLQDEEKEMILTLMRSLGNKSAIIRQTHLY